MSKRRKKQTNEKNQEKEHSSVNRKDQCVSENIFDQCGKTCGCKDGKCLYDDEFILYQNLLSTYKLNMSKSKGT